MSMQLPKINVDSVLGGINGAFIDDDTKAALYDAEASVESAQKNLNAGAKALSFGADKDENAKYELVVGNQNANQGKNENSNTQSKQNAGVMSMQELKSFNSRGGAERARHQQTAAEMNNAISELSKQDAEVNSLATQTSDITVDSEELFALGEELESLMSNNEGSDASEAEAEEDTQASKPSEKSEKDKSKPDKETLQSGLSAENTGKGAKSAFSLTLGADRDGDAKRAQQRDEKLNAAKDKGSSKEIPTSKTPKADVRNQAETQADDASIKPIQSPSEENSSGNVAKQDKSKPTNDGGNENAAAINDKAAEVDAKRGSVKSNSDNKTSEFQARLANSLAEKAKREQAANAVVSEGESETMKLQTVQKGAEHLGTTGTVVSMGGMATELIGKAVQKSGVTTQAAGATTEAAGAATTAAGGATTTAGATPLAAGAPLVACVYTAPVGAGVETTGGAVTSTGVSTTATGGATTASGAATVASGTATQGTGLSIEAGGKVAKSTGNGMSFVANTGKAVVSGVNGDLSGAIINGVSAAISAASFGVSVASAVEAVDVAKNFAENADDIASAITETAREAGKNAAEEAMKQGSEEVIKQAAEEGVKASESTLAELGAGRAAGAIIDGGAQQMGEEAAKGAIESVLKEGAENGVKTAASNFTLESLDMGLTLLNQATSTAAPFIDQALDGDDQAADKTENDETNKKK